jgi:hypothetical protein
LRFHLKQAVKLAFFVIFFVTRSWLLMKRLAPLGVGILLSLLLGVLLTPVTATDTRPLDDIRVSPYFPMKPGTIWEYSHAGKKIVVKVAAHDDIDGQTCARLETDSGGRPLVEHVTVKEDGIYRVRANGVDIKPPLLLLKLPPTKGDTWSVDSNVQNFPLAGKLTLGEEKLMVGTKAYDTITVKSSDMVMGGQSVSIETWYAKDVGMVKQHVKLADYEVVLELTEFTAGK